jgi:Xaa-Pro dipeptidase
LEYKRYIGDVAMKQLRLKNIIKNMEKHNLEQMLITSPASIFYLTGKWIEPGERMLTLYINTNGKTRLFINALFPISEDLGAELQVFSDTDDSVEILSKFIENKKLGIDKTWPSHFLISLMNKKPDISFINGSPIVDEVRMIKDHEEIELMREATRVNDKVIEDLANILEENYEEKKLCKLLDELYGKYGTNSFSFHPLIAYGKNAAEPHHDSDNTRLKEGDSVIMDIGGRTNMYCSDMTRTMFYKKVSEEQEKVYNLVLEANKTAIEVIKPGVRFCDIDFAARSIIDKAGYGKYFTHRTGHNIGIEVHEFPDVSSANEMLVQKDMIFSIEPGIYLPERFGVRIEDLVLVTDNGCEVLNSYNKNLKVF